MDNLFEGNEAVTPEEAFKRYIADLSAVLKTPEGARVVCEILERAGTFDQAWHTDIAQMTMSCILRDFGQTLLDDVALAGEDIHNDIQRMMRVRRQLDVCLRADNNNNNEEEE